MAAIDLHQLANTGSYGAARQRLAEAGTWDEYAGLPQRLYAVAVEYTVRDTVTVKARHPREAEDKARWKVCYDHTNSADLDFDTVEALKDTIGGASDAL